MFRESHQGERVTKEIKEKEEKGKRETKGEGNEKKIILYPKTKKENYLYSSLRVRAKNTTSLFGSQVETKAKKNDVRNSSTQRSYNLQHRCRETCDIHEQVS